MVYQASGRRRVCLSVAAVLLVLGLHAGAVADVLTIRQNLDKYWSYRSMQRTNFILRRHGTRTLDASLLALSSRAADELGRWHHRPRGGT